MVFASLAGLVLIMFLFVVLMIKCGKFGDLPDIDDGGSDGTA